MLFPSRLLGRNPSHAANNVRRARVKPGGFRPGLESLEGRVVLSTLTVINNLDSGPGSLRAEILAASPGDTVNFDPGLNGQTITLTSNELDINKSLTIQGPGAAQLAISGGHTWRVFDTHTPNTNVMLSGLTITQGNGRGYAAGGSGGGIANGNGCTLTVSGCTVSNNRASNYGGGIYNSVATLNIVNSTISGNSVNDYNGGGKGGGVYSTAGAVVSITGCAITNNTAGFQGGGIWIIGTTMTISGSTLSGNKARFSGGVFNGASSAYTLTVTNCVFSANTSTYYSYPITGPWTNGGGNTFK